MIHGILRWIVSIVALYITVYVGQLLKLHLWLQSGLPGLVAAMLVVTILVIVNAIVAPVLKFLSLPINCLTFGLFGFVINAVLFWTVGQHVPGFHVRGPIASLFGTVFMGFVSGALGFFVRDRKKQRR